MGSVTQSRNEGEQLTIFAQSEASQLSPCKYANTAPFSSKEARHQNPPIFLEGGLCSDVGFVHVQESLA